MNRGYVKLWRKITESSAWQEGTLLERNLLIELMLRVSRKRRILPKGLVVEPGEIITTYANMAQWVAVVGRGKNSKAYTPSTQEMRTAVRRLLASGSVSVQQAEQQTGLRIKFPLWATYQSDADARATDLATEVQQTSNRPPTVQQEKKKEEVTHMSNGNGSYPPDFELFWSVYPRREAKRSALKAWQSALKRSTTDEILTAIRVQAPTLGERERQYQPMPASWLNEDRWLDQLQTTLDCFAKDDEQNRRMEEQHAARDRMKRNQKGGNG